MEKLLEKDPTKELLEYHDYREENRKKPEGTSYNSCTLIIMSVQQPTENVQPSTQVSSLQYGYMTVPPQHTYGYMEIKRRTHQVQGGAEYSVKNNSPTFFSL